MKKVLVVFIIIVLIVISIFAAIFLKNKLTEKENLSKVFFSEDLERVDSSRIEEPEREGEGKVVKILEEEINLTYKYTRGETVVYQDSSGKEYTFKNDVMNGFIRNLPETPNDKITEEKAKEIADNFISSYLGDLANGFELTSNNYRYGEHYYHYTKKYLGHNANNYIRIAVFDNGEITTFQYNYDEEYEKLNSMDIDIEEIEKIFSDKLSEKFDVSPEDCTFRDGHFYLNNGKLIYMAEYSLITKHQHDYIYYELE